MDFFDFFSGCGGTSQGMQEAGLNVRLGIDIDSDAAKTYRANFPKAKFLETDIRRLTANDLSSCVSVCRSQPIVFAACAPCQPFSRQQRRKKNTDGRADLLRAFHKFVRGYLPEYIFIENVPGIQSIDDRRGPFASFLRLLTKYGYWHSHKVISACHYGVPQHRRRLVLIASRLAPMEFPAPTHGPDTDAELPGVWDAIRHLPRLRAGQTHRKILNHCAANLSPTNLKRIKAIRPGQTRAQWPKRLRLECHENHSGHSDVYGRMSKAVPSAALTTRCTSLSNGRFGHPTQHRAISVREAACIQTFPMDFRFEGNITSATRQVGNAVPVELAKVFGKAMLRHYRTYRAREKR